MGQRIIDLWAKKHINKPSVWGVSDCHQLLYEFLRLQHIDWKDEEKYGLLKGTYSNFTEANEIAKSLDIPKLLEKLGYTRRSVNRVESGDIICIETKTRSYDWWFPVIYGRTIINIDHRTNLIGISNVDDIPRKYEVYRRS